MPFSELKIDRSFVSDLLRNKESREISEAIIALSHKMGLNCLAEGVESREILDALGSMGCDYAQGYYLSRPIAGDRILDFVREYRCRLGAPALREGQQTATVAK
jgi:EAL domain-containing protein (putative c-di-GMP-specific phosphodiesterase class I)